MRLCAQRAESGVGRVESESTHGRQNIGKWGLVGGGIVCVLVMMLMVLMVLVMLVVLVMLMVLVV